jgi:glycosyltransferase involved in cell wall biosynthesis
VKILLVLTYYRPHTSGLTIYAERLARGLEARGHQVTILTSRYLPNLPIDSIEDGVRVVRAPVAFRISKGVIMPTFGWLASRLVKENDVVSLHLPQFDAAGVAARARIYKKPSILTYHCDLKLPPGLFNVLVNQVVHVMNMAAGMFADKVVAYTSDFAEHSPFLTRFNRKLEVIPPPVEVPEVGTGAITAFGKMHNPEAAHPVIGMAARLAAEKGVEVLLEALPSILQRYPDARVLFAGQYRDVLGEEAYAMRLRPLLKEYEGCWKFLGVLNPLQMAAFFHNLDVLVVPSLNSTESFGLVQVEAMLCGVPVVASDLPGVRQPALQSAMGEIAPIGSSDGLAQAILEILDHPERYRRTQAEITELWNVEQTAFQYESLFSKILELKRNG